MNSGGVSILGDMSKNTLLYRYIGLSQFLSLVETHLTVLTNVKQWEDTWEIPYLRLSLRKITDIKTPIDYTIGEILGQCWSRNGESDALWRIYSPNKEGLMIVTTAKQFRLIDGIKGASLAPVIYYDDVRSGKKLLKEQYGDSQVYWAYLKRQAFEHEREVRLAMVGDGSGLCVDGARLMYRVNPLEFIEDIVIDPRASDWFVETIQGYCKRVGFGFAPSKSKLYCPLELS